MESLRQYLLSIISAALICAVIQSFQQQSTQKALTRTTCGLIMVISIIAPLRQFHLSDFSFPQLFSKSRSDAVATGEIMSREALVGIIKAETEAYIQEKASVLGASVTATVTLSADSIPLPVAVQIHGTVPPNVQIQLQTDLCAQLGIAKENLTWIG